MSNKFFSPSAMGFYDDQDSGYIPEDAVSISLELYLSLLEGESKGKTITVENGFPKLINRVEKDNTQVLERVWAESELIRARDELEKVQDADPKAIGTVGQWREYRKALRQYIEANKDVSAPKNRPVLAI